jgi:hypothetical protein
MLEKDICQSAESLKIGMKEKINFVQLKYEILLSGCIGRKKSCQFSPGLYHQKKTWELYITYNSHALLNVKR